MKKGVVVILLIGVLILCLCLCCCGGTYWMTTRKDFRDGYCQSLEDNNNNTEDSDPFNWCN